MAKAAKMAAERVVRVEADRVTLQGDLPRPRAVRARQRKQSAEPPEPRRGSDPERGRAGDAALRPPHPAAAEVSGAADGCPPDGMATLAFVGDVMIGRLVNEVLRHTPPAYPWGDTLAILRDADCRVGNLECVISDRGAPWSATPKAFHFRSDAKNVEVLEIAGIDAVSLANNHCLDFGHEAMLDMLQRLDEAGIHHAGAGADLAAASRPAVLVVNGIRVGMIAFTDNEPAWEARGGRAGVHYVPVDREDPRAAALVEGVRRAKETTDVLIVSAHWGGNWGYTPPGEHRSLARVLIDAGADVIFGHSCHVVRGLELYRGRPVVYSAGNFVDDYAVDPIERNDRSFVFVLEVGGARPVGFRLHPTVIRDFQTRTARGREAQAIAAKMLEQCAALGTMARWRPTEGCVEVPLTGQNPTQTETPGSGRSASS